jgi:hypothetical protein
MVKVLIAADPKLAPWEQETPLHNRWHPGTSVERGGAEHLFLLKFVNLGLAPVLI